MPIPNSKDFFENTVDDFESIVTFSHVEPGGDAYGSSMGLKLAFDYLYPEKKTWCVGTYDGALPRKLPRPTKPDDLPLEVIQKSLCIVTDTPSADRIQDPRALQGKMIVKIDHHPMTTNHFGDLEFVDEAKSSASLIVADMLFASFPVLSALASNALLFGMLSDNSFFRFSQDADDFSKAGRLIYNGARIQDCYELLHKKTLKDFEIEKVVLSSMKVEGKVCYCTFDKKTLSSLKISADEMASHVDEIGFTKECPVWAFFVEYPSGRVRAELRSDWMIDVSPVAFARSGGGHRHSAGCLLSSLAEVPSLVKDLEELS